MWFLFDIQNKAAHILYGIHRVSLQVGMVHSLVGSFNWRTPCHSKEMWLWMESSEKAFYSQLTHWGQVTHICIHELTIIRSDNGLSPGRHQTIIRTNAGISLIGSLETNFREILIDIYIFIQENAFEIVVWKMAAILSRPQCIKWSSCPCDIYNRECVIWCQGRCSQKADELFNLRTLKISMLYKYHIFQCMD